MQAFTLSLASLTQYLLIAREAYMQEEFANSLHEKLTRRRCLILQEAYGSYLIALQAMGKLSLIASTHSSQRTECIHSFCSSSPPMIQTPNRRALPNSKGLLARWTLPNFTGSLREITRDDLRMTLPICTGSAQEGFAREPYRMTLSNCTGSLQDDSA